MPIEFHGGRLPNDPAKPRLKLGNFLTKIEYSPKADWFSAVEDWPMYANDRIGDCTCAAVGHIIEAVTKYGQGQTVKIPESDVIGAYSAITGYDPATGANDDGAVMQDVLNYWRKEGIGGYKILAFAEVNPRNIAEVFAACELFGNVYLGINFPAFAMDQFNAGEPWDVQDQNSGLEGGHAINGGWYDAESGLWKVITWGRVQDMTQAFFDKYVEEAWVVITSEWVEGDDSPAGIDIATLGQKYEELTGEPNPFPTPEPAPSPDPSPEPPIEADDLQEAVEEFFKWLKEWLKKWFGNKKFVEGA
jgi:hypothetical protein